jgi:hypothetical protein
MHLVSLRKSGVTLGLATAAEMTELPATEGRTAEKVAKMVVVAEIAAL